MSSTEQSPPDPQLNVIAGDAPGHTYETPLTLGPDSDHVDDPIRANDSTRPTQRSAFANGVDETEH